MTQKTQMTVEEGRRLVALLLDGFFTRTDTVAALMEWGSPHPIQGHDNLPGLLQAHILGEASPHRGAARYENRQGHIKVQKGLYRTGSYTPDKDGNTRWLCLDFDGAGHSDPLADPEAAARQTQDAFAQVGIPAYLEKSGGGKGWHVWVLFTEPVSAKQVRALAHRLIPDNLPLANSKGVAMPRSNRGVEVFPKQDKPATPKRLGNLVWLPWFHGAPEGANQFYRIEDGHLVPFVPDHFDKASLAQVAAALDALDQRTKELPGTKNAAGLRTVVNDAAVEEFLRRADKDDATTRPPSSDWQSWKETALAVLDLQQVYGRWLTGKSAGEHWLQCQDPDSDSGSNSRSGNVADGTGQALRGTFHSWRTEESMSVFDFMLRQGMASSFIDAARQIAEWTGVPLPERPQPPPDRETEQKSSYPVIVVNGRQLRDIVWDSWQALHAANRKKPFLFSRSGQVVGLRFSGPVPQMEFVDEATLYGLLATHANWVRRTEEGDSDVMPSKDAAKVMLTDVDTALPPLDSVVSAPAFDEKMRLSATPGYQPDARVWYHEFPGFHMAPVPAKPTPEDIARATSLILDDLFVDFPFVSQADRAHAVAGLILPFVRRLIPGPTPVHLFEAQMPGAGKTLLAEVIAMVATGESGDPTTLGRDDEEIRKKITSLLVLGRSVVLIDNVRAGIDSANLAAALTAETWQDRLLGQNTMVRLPNRAVWLVTANNPDLTLEIARRSIRIRIEPKTERPWQREGFKHSPLKTWVREHRGELVWAVLVLVQTWIAEGAPKGLRTLGSFEQWADVLGGILEEVGILGFLGNTEELYQAADVEGQEFREFVQAWEERHGTTPVSAGDLLHLALDRDLLMNMLGSKSERSQAIRLGKVLKANRNRRYGDLQVETSWALRTKQNEWRLVKVDEEETVGSSTRVVDLFSPRDVEAKRGMSRDVENPTSRGVSPSIHRVETDARGMSRDVKPTLAGGIGRHDACDARTCQTGPIESANQETHPATSREAPETRLAPDSATRDVVSPHPAQHPAKAPQHPAAAFQDIDLADLPDSDDEVES